MKGRTRKPHAYHRKVRHELEKVPVTPAHLRQPNGTSQQRSRSVTHLSSLVRIISRTSNEGLQKHSRKLRQQSKACRPPTSRKPTLHPHCTAAQAHETQLNALRPVRHATSRALGQPRERCTSKATASLQKASFACPQLAVFRSEIWAGSEWDSSSAYRPGKAGQAFTLAWQSAIRLARRSSSSPRHRHGRQRTNDWSERASDDERSLPERKATSSKFPASWQTSSGVGAISRHRTPNTGVPAARLALRQSELASALARAKRRRRLVGWAADNATGLSIVNAMARVPAGTTDASNCPFLSDWWCEAYSETLRTTDDELHARGASAIVDDVTWTKFASYHPKARSVAF
jgi:hypothetical protein